MRNLKIYIEIDGKQRFVGNIEGNSYEDACFSYSKEYMVENYGNPISISLPFREGQFSSGINDYHFPISFKNFLLFICSFVTYSPSWNNA